MQYDVWNNMRKLQRTRKRWFFDMARIIIEIDDFSIRAIIFGYFSYQKKVGIRLIYVKFQIEFMCDTYFDMLF